MTIGETNAGTVNVNNGGTLSAANVVIAEQAGSTGTLNIGTPGGSDTAGTIDTTSIAFGAGNGTINFNQIDATTLAAAISGTGSVSSLAAQSGSTIFAGAASPSFGALTVSGNASLARVPASPC